MFDATLKLSKTRTIKAQRYPTIYSTSPAPPDATRFQYHTLAGSQSPNPLIGYLHLNTATGRYWVFDGSQWIETPENKAFVHPSAVPGAAYTWDPAQEHWVSYRHNSRTMAEEIEGNEVSTSQWLIERRILIYFQGRKRKLNSKGKKRANEDTPGAGPSTLINVRYFHYC
jgi:hypothetical protein